MGKKKNKKNKKTKVRPPLKYKYKDVVQLAQSIIAVNPYMKNRTSSELTESIINAVECAYNSDSTYVSTGGWIAIFDEWEDFTYVEFYIQSNMVYDRIFLPKINISSDKNME